MAKTIGLAGAEGLIKNTSSTKTAQKKQRNRSKEGSAVFPIEAFFQTTRYKQISFSPENDDILVTADIKGAYDIYRVSVIDGQVMPVDSSVVGGRTSLSYFPDDKRFLFQTDGQGDEKNHIFVQERDGHVLDLTPGQQHKAKFIGWSGDKKVFWLATTERTGKAYDVYEYDTQTYERQRIFTNSQHFAVSDVSPDGRWVALTKKVSNAEAVVYVWDRQNPGLEPQQVSLERKEAVDRRVMTFSPDSKTLIYLSDYNSEYQKAWSYNMQTAQHTPEIEADGDVVFMYYSHSGRYRVTAVSQDAGTRVQVLDTQNHRPVELGQLPKGEVKSLRFSLDETKIAFYLNSSRSPSELYLFDIEHKRAKQLTRAMSDALDTRYLVEGEHLYYKSFDGLSVPMIMYRPKQARDDRPVPALIWVHGGPGGQSTLDYNATIQILVNQGYAVFAVNHRGSKGYGKTFYHLDDCKHGDVDLKDLIAAKSHIETLPWVQDNRIGIMGASYGGYLVAAAMAFAPNTFRVGIDLFGITNWERTLTKMPPWWAKFKAAIYAEMGDPATDGQRHRAISPIFSADKIKHPLMVVQGANDPRVLQAESDDLVAAVKRQGTPVEYVLFADEGHGILKKKNKITAIKAYLSFLETHLPID